MRFKEIVESSSQAIAVQKNIVTDGEHSCSYQEMPALLGQIHEHFVSLDIAPDDCIAYECANRVPDAMVLLYLMAYNRHFILLPVVDVADKDADLKPVPQFCKYRLTINHVDPTWSSSPESAVALEENTQYNGLQVPDAHGLPEGAIYLRTSGSMGTSKIVVHSHAKMLGNAQNCVDKYHYEATDRVSIPVPLAHMYGFGAVFLPAVMVGASIDLQEKTNFLKYLARERSFNPNIAYVTPTLCDMLLQAFRTPRNYKFMVTSGQRINDQLFREFDARIGGCLVNQYGSSEMGAISACDPSESVEIKDQAIGQPMTDVQLRIHEPQPDTGIGELQCRHPYGFAGYVDEAGSWITRIQSDEWYVTGDLAKQDGDGHIYVVGRAQNSVNRNGYLVLLSDIERIMEEFESLKQVFVVASAGETKRGERLTAFCVPSSDSGLTGEAVRSECFDRLPRYAIPDEVRIVNELPLLPSGKVDKQKLQKQASS